MTRMLRAAAIAVLLIGGTAGAAAAQDAAPAADAMFRATTLSLSAFGEVKARPDTADISLGVQTQARTAADAMAQNAVQMNRIMAALRASGVAEDDIQTSNLRLEAQYAQAENQPQRLTGYQAANTVTITVGDLTRLGRTLDAVVAAGANQVDGVDFRLRDAQTAEDQARTAAVKSLQQKAELCARVSGYRIGRLVNLSEGGGGGPPPVFMKASAMMAGRASTPVSPGELTVRADISGVYELTR